MLVRFRLAIACLAITKALTRFFTDASPCLQRTTIRHVRPSASPSSTTGASRMKATVVVASLASLATSIVAKPNARSLLDLDLDINLDRVVAKPSSKKPNIILFCTWRGHTVVDTADRRARGAVTDDQDVSTVKREYLPKLFEHVADHGTRFDNFFAPVSVCCPSRVSLLRTQLAHNHNVTFVTPPWGGWVRFNELGVRRPLSHKGASL